jgi:hypothetical protein
MPGIEVGHAGRIVRSGHAGRIVRSGHAGRLVSGPLFADVASVEWLTPTTSSS